MARGGEIELIGYCCGLGAGLVECRKGPQVLQSSSYLVPLSSNLNWHNFLPEDTSKGKEDLKHIHNINKELAACTATLVAQEKFFVTIGGDHTSAIGTWSGVATAIKPLSLGLIWIDAHLDSHTDETTPSGNIHGMPLAALLGHGNKSLTEVLSSDIKLLPQNVCIVGARSFEKGEQQLLESLKVRIFYMEEIERIGLEAVLKEAHAIVTRNAQFFGVSLDLDAIDPQEAPGVGSPERNGLHETDLFKGFDSLLNDPKMIGAEIVEFNPDRDQNQRTEMLIAKLLEKFVANRGQ